MTESNQIKPVFMTYNDLLKNDVLNNNHILGIINFSNNKKDIGSISNKPIPYLNLNIPALTNEDYLELWLSKEEVTYYSNESFTFSTDNNYMFGVTNKNSMLDHINETANNVYNELFKTAKDNNKPYINRIWNFIPQINQIYENKYHYEHFCTGRYRSFKNNNTLQYPAGTAVGAHSSNMSIYFIASSLNDLIYIENPNQTPAYKYNATNYPCFSRGCYDPQSDIFYISGTASIINNNSTGIKNIEKQYKTTIENITKLISRDNLSQKGINKDYTLKNLDCIKVYIKNNKDFNLIKDLCSNTFSKESQIIYLQSDICRPELLLEIEGIIQN